MLDMQIFGNWKRENFIEDFICTWFPKHGKGSAKKLWPKKEPDKGRKFWEEGIEESKF